MVHVETSTGPTSASPIVYDQSSDIEIISLLGIPNTVLTTQPLPVEPGQQVKLDASVQVNVIAPDPGWTLIIAMRIVRDLDDTVLTSATLTLGNENPSNIIPERSFMSINLVDDEPLDNSTYSLVMQVSVSGGVDRAEVETRGLTAAVFSEVIIP